MTIQSNNKESSDRKIIVGIACGAIGVAINIVIIIVSMLFGADYLVEILFKKYIFFLIIIISYFVFRNRLPIK